MVWFACKDGSDLATLFEPVCTVGNAKVNCNSGRLLSPATTPPGRPPPGGLPRPLSAAWRPLLATCQPAACCCQQLPAAQRPSAADRRPPTAHSPATGRQQASWQTFAVSVTFAGSRKLSKTYARWQPERSMTFFKKLGWAQFALC